MRHGGRSRRGTDFMIVPPVRGKPILVVGGGKNLTFRREIDSAGASQDPSLGGPERRIADTPPGDDVTLFWTVMGQELGAVVEFVNGTTNILNVNFRDYSIIVVAGDQFETYYGGLTAAEHDALSLRADDIRDFLSNGGGVVASLSPFRSRHFQTPLLPFSGLPAYRVSSTWGSYAWLREVVSELTTRFFYPDDLEHMWQSQSGPTFAPGTYCLPTAVPEPPVVAAGAGSFAQVWRQTPVSWHVTQSTIGEAPQNVLPGAAEFEIVIPGDPLNNIRRVVGAISRIVLENATQWRPGVGSFRFHLISESGGSATWKGVRICHTRGGTVLGTFSLAPFFGAELVNLGVWQGGETSGGAFWTAADEATRSTTPIQPGDEMLIMWLFGNESAGDSTIRIRFDQIDFWSFTGYTNADPTGRGAEIGMSTRGFTAVVAISTGAGSHRWMQTFTATPTGMEPLALAGGTAVRHRTEPAIIAGFNSVQGDGTLVLIGCPWEDGVFYDPAAVGVSGQTLPKIPTETVPTGNPNEFVARPVGNPNRQCGAFDGWVRLMEEVMESVERTGIRVRRQPISHRPWAAAEEVQL